MSDPEVMARVAQRIAAMMPRTARWRYFQDGHGPMFVWNVEPLTLIDESDPANGKYESMVVVPYGRGSRSGKATRWKPLEASRSAHTLRRDAKARALRLYRAWQESGKIEL